jgi:hypothetical protein
MLIVPFEGGVLQRLGIRSSTNTPGQRRTAALGTISVVVQYFHRRITKLHTPDREGFPRSSDYSGVNVTADEEMGCSEH